ncbi:MAG: NAD(P)H-hydrate dehydratase [Planctomycetia bacterium]
MSGLVRPEPLPLDAHKGLAGRVAILAGSRWMRGAATLACRAAGRGGAGLVACLARDAEVACQVFLTAPECVVEDCAQGGLAAAWARRAPHSMVAGCGLSQDELAAALVDEALSFDGPLLLDADALNLLAGGLERIARRAAPTVLTPHPLEAARLLGCSAAIGADEAERLAAARELSAKSGAVVVLKGAGTLVCSGTRAWRCPRGTPALAKAGTGDVLAGLAGALLARSRSLPRAGFDAHAAACLAVERHALAGELAEAALSREGLVAGDLLDFLPAAERAHG